MADDKYKSAGNIRSKITRFDFEGTASANIALSKKVGDVASVIEKKTDEQNRRFDKLLKVLEFLPKDALEKRKQDKIVFTELARTVAMLEKEAKASIKNRPKYFELRKQADDLREQGRKLAPDFDKSKPQGIKEWGYKILGFNPQRARENGLGGEIAQTLFPTFTGIAKKFSNKNSFDRQVEQEKLYPETASKTEEAMIEARKKGGIEYTDEKGITSGKGRGEGGGGEGSSSVILRTISHAVLDIRDHIVGKNKGSAPDATEGNAPKSMFSAADLDKKNPDNYTTRKLKNKKGQYTGKTQRVWSKRSKYGNRRFLKPGEEDVEPVVESKSTNWTHANMRGKYDTTNSDEVVLTDEQKAKAAGTFDDDKLKKEGQDQPQPKYAESGTEKEEPTKVEGSMTGSDGGSIIAIIAVLEAIVAGVEGLGGVMGTALVGALGIAGAGLIIKDIYDLAQQWNFKKDASAANAEHRNDTRIQLEETAKRRGTTVREMLLENKKNGSAGAQEALDEYEGKTIRSDETGDNIGGVTGWWQKNHGKVRLRTVVKGDSTSNKMTIMENSMFPISSNSGDALEQGASESSAPTIIAPTTNNITNNGGGGGSSKSSDPGMPSARTPNPTFQRTEEKRQTRQF